MIPRLALTLNLAIAPAIAAAQDGGPLSAIDWLSQSVVEPATSSNQIPNAATGEPPVANGAGVPEVTVTPLDAPSDDPVGILGSEITGLPPSLWSLSDENTLVTLTRAQMHPALPAIRDLLVTLMLAEADPPLGAGPQAQLFLARIDALLALGAVTEAQALLQAADADTPESFRRLFDAALLSGAEDEACAVMEDRPSVAPTFPARIFCLARLGDWPAAALTLNTHRVLGDVSVEEEELLARFLDPELFEGPSTLPAPSPVSPLQFRLREAIGEGLATAPLPLAFAHADLRDTNGWKTQIDAAERLARAGAIPGNVLFDIYTLNQPAASGGAWDRVAALQAFDRALNDGDKDDISKTLSAAWEAMTAIRAETVFAAYFGSDIKEAVGDDALAVRIGLLSPEYESVARDADVLDPFLRALAMGRPEEAEAKTPRQQVVRAGFGDAQPPEALRTLADQGKLGEALLRAITDMNTGVTGDPRAVSGALALLRHVGLEDAARRAALQYLILERPT